MRVLLLDLLVIGLLLCHNFSLLCHFFVQVASQMTQKTRVFLVPTLIGNNLVIKTGLVLHSVSADSSHKT